MKQLVMLLCLALLFTSCSTVPKLLKGGSVSPTSFTEKVPFDFQYGIPIVKVDINGKSYRFLFDTGAASVISPELAASLGLKPKTSGATSDSQDNSSREQFVVVPEMKLGNLNFKNTGAIVIDLKKGFDFRCVGLDGILGSNQMAKAFWEIDYKNRMLTAASDISAFHIPAASRSLSFIPKRRQLTPLVPVKIGDKSVYATFDTGFSGDFTLTASSFGEEVRGLAKLEATGASVSGLYGGAQTSITTYVKIPMAALGDITLQNQIFEFRETSSLVGNDFLKNYRVVIDWKTSTIHLTAQQEYNNSKVEGFGLLLKYVNNKPLVSKIYKNSDAEKAGMLINDEVIAVNGATVDLTESQACQYTFNNIFNGMQRADITILRAGKPVVVALHRAVMLQ